jgi:Zn-dependent protease
MFDFIIYLIPIIFAITVHEVAHGWVAFKLGDNTAKSLGRLTLNPIPHIDILGTIVIPIILYLTTPFIFGFAKPVPINYRNLRNAKKDVIYVALAGPASNIIMAFLWAFVLYISLLNEWLLMGKMAFIGIFFNLLLAIFNMIPIPPLDGSVIIRTFLPRNLLEKYDRMEIYGIFIVFALLFMGLFTYVVLPLLIVGLNTLSFIYDLPITELVVAVINS